MTVKLVFKFYKKKAIFMKSSSFSDFSLGDVAILQGDVRNFCSFHLAFK